MKAKKMVVDSNAPYLSCSATMYLTLVPLEFELFS